MTQYIRKYDTVNTIQVWAQKNLSEQELIDFQNAIEENNQLWGQYANQGLITPLPIEKVVYSTLLNEHITLRCGDKIIVNDPSAEIKMAYSYEYWHARYISEGGEESVQYVD